MKRFHVRMMSGTKQDVWQIVDSKDGLPVRCRLPLGNRREPYDEICTLLNNLVEELTK